jgi:hypothetical protein
MKACMSLLFEEILFLHSQTQVLNVLGAIFESGYIRESRVKTTFDARAMASGCAAEDTTAVLLKYIISQQGKSLGPLSSLSAAATSHVGHIKSTKVVEGHGWR